MSGLVGYASSDEEDVPSLAHPRTTSEHLQEQNTDAASLNTQHEEVNGVSAASASAQVTGPIVGPLAPQILGNGLGAYDELDALLSQMPERDILRMLTQASHPMVEMPSSPPGSPDIDTSARFVRFLKLKSEGLHFNEDLAKKNAFKNPAVLDVLMERNGLDGLQQYSSSLPLTVYNPSALPSYAFKENLLESQNQIRIREDIARKSRSVAGTRTIDFEKGSASQVSSRTSTPGANKSAKNR